MLSSEEFACVATALACCDELENSTKKKRRWMKEWFMKRQKYTHENLLKELRFSEPQDFTNFLRMDSELFDLLLEMVTPHIEKENTVMRDSIPASQRLLVTLRYLTTGSTFEDLKFSSAISPQSISRIVMETCEAIIQCLKEYIQLPKTQEEWKEVAKGFEERWNFPNCVGAIDGQHIEIKKPHLTGSFYFNYKNFFSIVLLAVVNSQYEFLMADVGINGRVSDGGVFSETMFGNLFNEKSLLLPEPDFLTNTERKLPYVFVADDAFRMTENLLKPYAQSNLDLRKNVFNYRLSRARRIVENVFGIMSSRFGIFQRPIQLEPPKARLVTLACCYLHNFLSRKRCSSYIYRGCVDAENQNTGQIVDGTWRANVQVVRFQDSSRSIHRNSTDIAKEVRESYCEYFNNEGKVPWQN